MVRDPHQEEDEGYLAAAAGLGLERNPYPSGTMRFDDWRRGWHIKQDEMRVDRDHPAFAVEAGKTLDDNPHPKGTIRYEEWRRAWLVKHASAKRSLRFSGEGT